jgi:hypothetical protein
MHGIRVDGNDLWAVYNATKAARDICLQVPHSRRRRPCRGGEGKDAQLENGVVHIHIEFPTPDCVCFCPLCVCPLCVMYWGVCVGGSSVPDRGHDLSHRTPLHLRRLHTVHHTQSHHIQHTHSMTFHTRHTDQTHSHRQIIPFHTQHRDKTQVKTIVIHSPKRRLIRSWKCRSSPVQVGAPCTETWIGVFSPGTVASTRSSTGKTATTHSSASEGTHTTEGPETVPIQWQPQRPGPKHMTEFHIQISTYILHPRLVQ